MPLAGIHGRCSTALISSHRHPRMLLAGIHGRCSTALISSHRHPRMLLAGIHGRCSTALISSHRHPRMLLAGIHGRCSTTWDLGIHRRPTSPPQKRRCRQGRRKSLDSRFRGNDGPSGQPSRTVAFSVRRNQTRHPRVFQRTNVRSRGAPVTFAQPRCRERVRRLPLSPSRPSCARKAPASAPRSHSRERRRSCAAAPRSPGSRTR